MKILRPSFRYDGYGSTVKGHKILKAPGEFLEKVGCGKCNKNVFSLLLEVNTWI